MGPISGWPAALSSSAAESCVRAGHPERAVWQRSGRGHGRLLSAGRVLRARNCGGRRLTGSRCLQCLPERNPEPSLKSRGRNVRSEEHTSELQSLMRISYAVFCVEKKNNTSTHTGKDTTLIRKIVNHNTDN